MSNNPPPRANEVEITFVLNGEDVTISANANQPVLAARNQALAESGNTGRPPDEWEIRTAAGVLIAPTTRVGDLPQGAKLVLSVATGSGG